MEIIKTIPKLLAESEKKFKNLKNAETITFNREDILKEEIKEYSIENKLYICDNIIAMKDLLDKGYVSKLDLIYIDPPFFTKADYTHRTEVMNESKKYSLKTFAYRDKWENGFIEYLEMITIRLFFIKELLSQRGTVYMHLDPKAVHYVKIIMDNIFGEDRFLNEIIWSYKSGGSGKRSFSRKHDNILVYTKSDEYIFNPLKEKSYNRGLKPYRFKNVKEYKDDIGWYTLVNLKDVWQIDMVGRTSNERVGYGTQKPETLLERIVLSSSYEESIVGDFFAGSGTTGVVAQRNKRNWILADLGTTSELIIRNRISKLEKVNYKIYKSEKTKAIETDLQVEYIEINNMLEINLNKYKVDIEILGLNIKDKKVIKSILKRNSLNLIDYIGIGYKNKEDDNLVIFEEITRDPNLLKVKERFSIDLFLYKKEHLYLKIIDIFGNSMVRKIF